jgi:hypothetical protein
MRKIILALMFVGVLAGSVFAQKTANSFGRVPIDKNQSSTRALTGTITSTDSYYVSGTTFDLQIDYDHDLAEEYVAGISLKFPEGVTVNSAIDIGTTTWNLEMGDGVVTTWGDTTGTTTFGTISADVSWTVNITVDAAFSGDLGVIWNVVGDAYGDAPHTLSGVFTLEEASSSDLAVTAVTPYYVYEGTSVTPVVTVMNNGSSTQDVFNVQVDINDGTSDVYTSTLIPQLNYFKKNQSLVQEILTQ